MPDPSPNSLLRILQRIGCGRKPSNPAAGQLEQIDWPALSWTFLTSWAGGACEIAPGLDIGRLDWHPVIDPESGRQRRVEGIDRVYGDRHLLPVWSLAARGSVGLFAAEEVSNGVWVVFMPGTALP